MWNRLYYIRGMITSYSSILCTFRVINVTIELPNMHHYSYVMHVEFNSIPRIEVFHI